MANAHKISGAMPFLLTGAALALLVTSTPGQESDWIKQAPLPSAETVHAIHHVSASDVWVSAPQWPYSNNGHVAHSTNAGQSWDVSELDLGGVSAIFFLDALHGWTAGGAMRHTTDGGQTWITDNSWGSMYDLFFIDTQRGWSCGNGGVAYTTTDGGLSWTGVTTPAGATLSSIWFQDATNGWAVAINGRILRSTTGGQNWTTAFDAGNYLSTIQFVAPLEGWAIGGDTFLHTTDGGANWSPVQVPAGTWVHAARFFDPLHGIAVGDAGNVLRTTDGGQSWSTVAPSGSGPGLLDVEYADAQTVFTSGAGGAISRSDDGGATWSSIQSGGWGIVRGLDVHDSQVAWAANQAGEIVRTTNGGLQWERVSVSGFNGTGNLHDIDFVDAVNGWAVGESNHFGGGEGRIAHSNDGGQTWSLQVNLANAVFRGVVALDGQRAVAFGYGSFAPNGYLETADGGQTWVTGGPPSSTGFRGGCFLPGGQLGWLVGDDIWHTGDGGASWSLQHPGPGPLFADVSFVDANHGWASGFANLLVHTTDGGLTWSSQDAGAPAGTALMGVSAVDSMTAWVTGWNGFVARTLDGGATWQQETLPDSPGANFECVEFLDAESGWVAGDYGIFRRGPIGCQSAETYCFTFPNSTGLEASIGFSGSCAVDVGELVLEVSDVPDQMYMFFFGPQQDFIPLGNGVSCVGGPLTRLTPPKIARGGFGAHTLDPMAEGFSPGQATNFQCWFRDTAAGGTGFNLSDGLHMVFE